MRELTLTKGYTAILDDNDFDRITSLYNISWYYNNGYATGKIYVNGKRKTILLHREIMCPSIGLVVDHINGNTLDNRHSNLRCVTQLANMHNTVANRNVGHSRYEDGQWVSYITSGGHVYVLGYFDTQEQAEDRWHDVIARPVHSVSDA